MWNDGLDEAQAGIKIARRNINNLVNADDTTLMAENEEELQSLLMRVKEESENVSWKLNIQKVKITASGFITSWQTEGEKVEAVTDFIFLDSKITADGDCYGKPRQLIRKLRHLFADKSPYSQSYGFSSSQVQMWVGP